ncbi:hypothetical protein [Neorhodopirellula pilleata]|uniref:Uncharacterized protein n=1 Tax=Neorhodopirellula pilleata TaxID=2714738 RepID=A0A5C5ZWT8_9BACT|nr:hypothetical protein [Neorhodopirellula pilleata]TWT91388.1 hypothetical protein Pla100_52380 [Neorhodopirellula pilleata]TWT91437.1 hypothetical protein Pla100_52870 [Neorhodopirellula pilleata]
MSEATETQTLGRAELDQLAKPRYGSFTLPTGARIVFMSLRRSVLYAIDAGVFDSEGNQVEGRLRERPARILAACLCDSKGARLYRDDEWERVDNLPPDVFEPLWAAVRKHLGFDDKAADDEAADSAKN